MKTKKFLLCFAMICVCLCSLVGLTACGDVSMQTLSQDFKRLEDTFKSHSAVFTTGAVEEFQSDYCVNYGTNINGYIEANVDGYLPLRTKYNVALALSNDYIDKNKGFILGLDQSKMDGKAKEAINKLDESINGYIGAVNSFVSELENFKMFAAEQVPENVFLINFKRSYGNLIGNSLNVSSKLCACVENTNIFSLLQQTEAEETERQIVKEYVCAKTLPIFTKFLIDETETALVWEKSEETQTKTRIDKIITKFNQNFDLFKQNFLKNSNLKAFKISDVLTLLNDQNVEFNNYYTAVSKLELKKLAVDCHNNLAEYKKTNKYAEIYIEKIEQFVNNSLANFLTRMSQLMFS